MITQNPTGPHYAKTARTRMRRFFHSAEALATLFTVMVCGGFGELFAGMILGINRSRGGNKGLFVPYVPNTYTATSPTINAGRTFTMGDVADGATTCTIPYDQMTRFKAGDDLIIDDNTTAAENLGAIVSVVATTSYYATITFTNPVTAAAGFLLANQANVYVNTGWCASTVANVAIADETLTVVNTRMDELRISGLDLAVGDALTIVSSAVDAEALGTVTTIVRGATNTTIGFSKSGGAVAAFAIATGSMVYVIRDNISYARTMLSRHGDAGDANMASVTSIPMPAIFGGVYAVYTEALGNSDANALSDLGLKQYQDKTFN